MKIVVAFDTFKGCVNGYEASEYVASRLTEHGAEAYALPLADGGEGTARALALLYGGTPVDVETVDAYGAPTEARVYLLPEGVAAVDMASCVGLGAAEGTSRARVMEASSYGLGLLLRRLAETHRPASVLLGAGGSASCDGATGLLAALGARLCFRTHTPMRPAGRHLAAVEGLDMSAVAGLPPVTLLCDVRAPLLGPDGAALRFAPQKGATPAQTLTLDAGLKRWCRIVARTLGADPRSLAFEPGMGTAGGITLAARLLGWQTADGAAHMTSLLSSRLEGAGLAITGEGRTDLSTLQGKAPYALMRRAAAMGIPTALLSGQLTLTPRQLAAAGFAYARAVSPRPLPASDISAAATLPRLAAAAIALLEQ